jgi:hypothetical protein
MPLGQALDNSTRAARDLDLPEPDVQHILHMLIQHALITHSTHSLET